MVAQPSDASFAGSEFRLAGGGSNYATVGGSANRAFSLDNHLVTHARLIGGNWRKRGGKNRHGVAAVC